MRITGRSCEDEMIACFVRAGLDSPRERDRLNEVLEELGVASDIARSPHASDEALNRARREVLVRWFGWGQMESVFGGMPDDVEWFWADLEEPDLDIIETIEWFFLEQHGTRRLTMIASRNGPSADNPILQAVRAGRLPEPCILLARPDLGRLVILEGHNRLLAYASDPPSVPFPLQVMLGTSPHIHEWSEW